MGKLVPLHRAEGRPDEMSGQALLAACAAEDTAALAALYERYVDDVYRCLMRLTWLDEPVVEDLVQDTFLQVFDSAASYNANASVRTWMLGIASNLARHHARTDSRRKQRQRLYLEKQHSDAPTPGTQAEQREVLAQIQRILTQLPYAQREAFVLCDIEGMKGVEAARMLDIPDGTLYRRLHKARKALQEALGGIVL